jgi:effector-binding domain-containing protein
MHFLFRIVCIFFSVVIWSCDSADQNVLDPKQPLSPEERLAAEELLRFNKEVNTPEAIGLRGVYNVPEMLSVVVLDSAPVNQLAERRAGAFAKIESDIKEMGAEIDGSPGSIYYSNNPDNFVFECLMLIRNMPKTNPKHSKIVVLEATPMLIFNHKGAFRNLGAAYARIKAYNDSSQLEQVGPMREFYIVSPLQTTDSNAWLTRIMVPVAKKQK